MKNITMKAFGRIVWEASMTEVAKALGGQNPLSYDDWYNTKYLTNINKKDDD